jgi:hypothetical protein
VQPRHQPRGQTGPADLVDELAADGVEPRPVDAPTQFQQFVSRVENCLEGLMSGCSAWSGLAGRIGTVSIRSLAQ